MDLTSVPVLLPLLHVDALFVSRLLAFLSLSPLSPYGSDPVHLRYNPHESLDSTGTLWPRSRSVEQVIRPLLHRFPLLPHEWTGPVFASFLSLFGPRKPCSVLPPWQTLDFMIWTRPPHSLLPRHQELLLLLMLKRWPVRTRPPGTRSIRPPLIRPGKDPQMPKKDVRMPRRALRTRRTRIRIRKP